MPFSSVVSSPSVHLYDVLPLAIFAKSIDENFAIVIWNTRAEQFWGMPRESVLGKTDYDLFPKEQADFFRSKDIEALNTQSQVNVAVEPIDTPNGRFLLRTKKVVVTDPATKKRYLLGISEDITPEETLRKELDSERAASATSMKWAALGEMAGSIAHEINTPLATLMLGFEQSIRYLDETPPKVEQARTLLKKILGTTERISSVIATLRVYARQSKLDKPTAMDLRKVVRESLDLCEEKLRTHQITLCLTLPETETLAVVRETELLQIILNLVSNAVDALKDVEKPRISLELEQTPNGPVLSVSDNGPGIPVENREKIFEPYFTTKPTGSGLGLAICQKLAKANNAIVRLGENPKSPEWKTRLEVCFSKSLAL